jgi:hypothetical protein
MIYVPSLVKTGSGIQTLLCGRFTDTQDGHLIRVFLFLLYRVIQEELPPLAQLISDDILSKKVSYKPGSYTQYL